MVLFHLVWQKLYFHSISLHRVHPFISCQNDCREKASGQNRLWWRSISTKIRMNIFTVSQWSTTESSILMLKDGSLWHMRCLSWVSLEFSTDLQFQTFFTSRLLMYSYFYTVHHHYCAMPSVCVWPKCERRAERWGSVWSLELEKTKFWKPNYFNGKDQRSTVASCCEHEKLISWLWSRAVSEKSLVG